MAVTETIQPQAVDYARNPLHEGDTVAFIHTIQGQPPQLFTGRIALIRKDQLCVESGNLHVRAGHELRAYGSTPERMAYDGIALRTGEDASRQRDILADAVRRALDICDRGSDVQDILNTALAEAGLAAP